MVAAIMGAQARLGIRKEHHEEFQAQKEAAEKKKKTTITAESFDKQVAHKMGEFFDDVFLPTLKKLVEAGLSYDEVKRLVKIPSTWGAKITGEQFEDRVSAFSRNEEPVSMSFMLTSRPRNVIAKTPGDTSHDDENRPGTSCRRLGEEGVQLRPLDRLAGTAMGGFHACNRRTGRRAGRRDGIRDRWAGLSPCDRRRASDPCWCHSFRTQHRGDHRPLALRLQAMRM